MEKLSHLFSSWNFCEGDFAPVLAQIRSRKSEFCRNDNSLSIHNGKDVWRIQLPADGRKFDFVYKICNGKKPWRYMFAPSLPVREAGNYRYLAKLNIPIPRVLAYGDVRSCFILHESYIVVEFIAGSSDGTSFMPGGRQRDKLTLAEDFTKRNFELLAKVHQHNFYHKAFHPRNSLFRQTAGGDLEVFWIDVAPCRIWSKPDMTWPIVHDLYTWLKDMQFEESVGLRCLEYYCRLNPKCPATAAELLAALQRFRRRSGAKAVNVFAR